MEVKDTEFGWIEIDEKKYNHDVIIYVNGRIENRYKNFKWTSHSFTLEEAEKVTKGDPEVLVLGTGQYGLLKPSQEAIGYLKKRKIRLFMDRTPMAIKIFNGIKERKCALFHVTC